MVSKREQCKNIAELPHIKCTWQRDWEHFRVTLDGLSKEREEAVAYYTDDFQDAFETAQCMSKLRVAELAEAKAAGGN